MIVQETLWSEKQKGVGSVKSERRGEERREKKAYALKAAATEYNMNAPILAVHS